MSEEKPKTVIIDGPGVNYITRVDSPGQIQIATALERIASALERANELPSATNKAFELQLSGRLVVKEDIETAEVAAFRHLVEKTNDDCKRVELEYSLPPGPTAIVILEEEVVGTRFTTFSLGFAEVMDVYFFGLSWAEQRAKLKQEGGVQA